MIFVLAALWGVAVVLLILNPKNASVRWLSAVAFCGGSGALAAVIGDHVIPWLQMQDAMYRTERFAFYVMATASIISYYGLPYTFIHFTFAYHPIPLYTRYKRWIPWVLLLPIVLMFLFTPVYTVQHPELYRYLAAWALPYVIIGTIIMVMKKELSPVLQRTHRITCIAVLSPVLFCSVMNYLLPAFGIYEMWRFNTWMIVFAVVAFIFALFTYGFLGMQILIQQKQLDTTMRAITSGTTILNHAIKNDVGKLHLFSEKIRRHAQKTGQNELLDDIDVIQRSAEHIQQLISRVQHQTRDIHLQQENISIANILNDALDSIHIFCEQTNINLSTQIETDTIIYADRLHLTEAIRNLLMNAIEAMPQGGQLKVRCHQEKKRVVISISDSGQGVDPKQIRQLLEPFYTSKQGGNNFGLGLSYSYSIIRKHRGNLQMTSELGQGTTVYVTLPMR